MAESPIVQPTPTTVPSLAPEPSEVEQEHIDRAIEASQTAMDAIGTVVDISTYTLTVLGVLIAILAIWGVGALVRTARAQAKQIANKRWDSYIESDEFKALVKSRIDEAVKSQKLDAITRKLDELVRDEEEDEPPFDEKGAAQ
ncbi:hypothetical protein [uncultured Erythrobacter sp.]|uniref:hypothetical protein n=1 Tax=uncultured Erythrobacter sp. TaxID=263913 RepID=UPI0026354E86|nr:hypothetical protein [uncultured Erythrobacter sp.]